MFPYDTPAGVTHWTLWSRKWLQEEEVEAFVDGWLAENLPKTLEWNHDDNMGGSYLPESLSGPCR